MFRRKDKNLPTDPVFPATLEGLGYYVNAEGQIINTKIGNFFPFFVTDRERDNEQRREAMHSCVREAMTTELAEMGIKKLYLGGEKGEEIFEEKPSETPHISVFTTEREVLKEKKDVIVVIGEHFQDCGVWSWRKLLTEGGMNGGSVVGLAKMLPTLEWTKRIETVFGGTRPDKELDDDSEDDSESVGSNDADDAEDSIESLNLVPNDFGADQPHLPGLVVLNPGELLYSHALNTNMTQPSWLSRPRPAHALQDAYAIDTVHNRVSGHASSEAHIATVLDKVLPKLLADDARLYVIGLVDGAEAFLNHMDAQLCGPPRGTWLGESVEAVAMCAPTHIPHHLRSEALTGLLSSNGRSWIVSDKQKGEFMRAPGGSLSSTGESRGFAGQVVKDDDGQEPIEQEKEAEGKGHDGDAVEVARDHGTEVAIEGEHTTQNPCDNKTNAAQTAVTYPNPDEESKPELAFKNLALAHSQDNANPAMQRSSDPSQEWGKVEEEGYDYKAHPVSCPTFSSGIQDVAELVMPNVVDQVVEFFSDEMRVKQVRDRELKDVEIRE